jgi:hypothetical protein
MGGNLATTHKIVFTYLIILRSRDRVPMRWIFSNLPNPSGRTMALGSTQPLTEMSTRSLKKENWG